MRVIDREPVIPRRRTTGDLRPAGTPISPHPIATGMAVDETGQADAGVVAMENEVKVSPEGQHTPPPKNRSILGNARYPRTTTDEEHNELIGRERVLKENAATNASGYMSILRNLAYNGLPVATTAPNPLLQTPPRKYKPVLGKGRYPALVRQQNQAALQDSHRNNMSFNNAVVVTLLGFTISEIERLEKEFQVRNDNLTAVFNENNMVYSQANFAVKTDKEFEKLLESYKNILMAFADLYNVINGIKARISQIEPVLSDAEKSVLEPFNTSFENNKKILEDNAMQILRTLNYRNERDPVTIQRLKSNLNPAHLKMLMDSSPVPVEHAAAAAAPRMQMVF